MIFIVYNAFMAFYLFFALTLLNGVKHCITVYNDVKHRITVYNINLNTERRKLMSNHLLLDQVIPIDFGFGYSKGKFKGKMYKQPSVVGEARRLYPQDIRDNDLQLGQMKTPEVFIPDYFVGDLAVRHSNTRYYSIGDDKANMWTTAKIGRASCRERV